ncbi:uncharacterized protein BKA55DRAFT_533682 [Fusarium redolens]|uniref:Uncharacterized protein n=1 Tax=Fusarium redolens TaxID=48865 RepID=A0A9P9KQY4_FUSRE|nr:uncharacterized protein BKA55DRAFT_533682 [Fusarium redolens]KAH7266880.1 hypothetical protein BKA55DRAFT_533682 [Fusarium redolens]
MDGLLGNVKRMPEGPENSTRPTFFPYCHRSEVMCLDQAVIVDPGPEFDVLRLITHLCVVNTSNGGMIVNILVYGTCPGREIGHTTTSARLPQIPGTMRRDRNAKVLRRNTGIYRGLNSTDQTRSRAQPSGPVISKNQPLPGLDCICIKMALTGTRLHDARRGSRPTYTPWRSTNNLLKSKKAANACSHWILISPPAFMAQTSRGSQLDQAGGNRWARVVADGGGDRSAGGTGAGRGSTAG